MSVITDSIGKNEEEWQVVVLSEKDSVKGLIRLRTHFDLLSHMDYYTGMQSSAELGEMPENAICIYAQLDRVISKTNFTDRQKEILNRHMKGESVEDIAEIDGTDVRNINRILDRVCDLIVETNYIEWAKWVHRRKLGAKTQKCKCCGKEKPVIRYCFNEGETVCLECGGEKEYYKRLKKEKKKTEKIEREKKWALICNEYLKGNYTQAEIAVKYGVSQSQLKRRLSKSRK